MLNAGNLYTHSALCMWSQCLLFPAGCQRTCCRLLNSPMLGSSPSRNSVTLPKQLPGGATWRTMLVVPMVPGCRENVDTLVPCSLRHVRYV